LKIALIQMDVALGEGEANASTAQLLLNAARRDRAQVALLPELWASGYDLKSARRHATPLDKGSFATASSLAVEYGLHVAGSLLESDREGVFNTLTVHSPAGALLGSYRKIHLFGLMDEPKFLVPGSQPTIVEIDGVRTALSICYDIRFPELFRYYTLAGASLILVSAEWPGARLDHWRTLLRSRAIENQCFVAACNRVGRTGDTVFGGHSMLVDPWGDVLIEGGDDESVLTAEIDLDRVNSIRRQYPFIGDRRNGIYETVDQPGGANR
jgi:predicted amidohydrolase